MSNPEKARRGPRPPRVDVNREGLAESEDALASRFLDDLKALLVALEAPRRELSLLLTDDAHIRALNAQWRGEDKATDILSFPMDELDPEAPLKKTGGSLGDLALSVETLRNDAKTLDLDPADLGAFLLVHGVLHLLGHDHGEPDEAARMRRAEDRLFAAIRPGHPRPPTPY